MMTIIHILQDYQEIWKTGLAALVLILVLTLLSRILKQMRKLNESLKSITTNMQAYFDVILTEDKELEESIQEDTEESIRAKVAELKKKEEEEKLFNAVLQEYFS